MKNLSMNTTKMPNLNNFIDIFNFIYYIKGTKYGVL